jgi:hypothetical protein
MEKLQNMWNAFDAGLVATVTAIFVAGLAAVLGIWMERDERKPPRYAYALSGLIVLAMLVSITQSYLDKIEQDVIKEDMARLLQTMDKLASESDNPELLALVQSELAAQSRQNPEVVEKVAQRVADAGGDPTEMLGKHLGEAELEQVSRKGIIKPKETGSKVVEKDKDKDEPTKDAAPAPRGRGDEPTDEGGGRRRGAAEEPAAAQPAVPVPTPTPTEPPADAAAAPTAGRRGAPAPAAGATTPAPTPTAPVAPATKPAPTTAKRPAKEPAKEPAKKGR